jgi:hypothetical protein
MNVVLLRVLGACAAVLFSGCGTVCNLAGGIIHPDTEPRVYGGVLKDGEILVQMTHTPSGETRQLGKGGLVVLPVAAIEVTLSLVADTVTLPITSLLQHRREAANERGRGADTASISAGAEAGIVAPLQPSPADQTGGGESAGPGGAAPRPGPDTSLRAGIAFDTSEKAKE